MRKIWKKLAAAGLAAAMTATALTGCGGKESAPAGSEAQTEAASEPVEITFRAEPIDGLAREVLLNQSGQLAWMEQTKVWKAYRKLKGDGEQRQEK